MKFFFSLLAVMIVSTNAVKALEVKTWQHQKNSGDIYETVDGTIFKKTGFGYVGYLSYHEEIMFLSSDEVCMGGSKFRISIYEIGSQYHYSISSYSGAEAYAKFEEICGSF